MTQPKQSESLQKLMGNIVSAHNSRMEVVQARAQEKRDEMYAAHEAAVKELTLGIDWEIDEVQTQINEDQYYLDELLSIKKEALETAYDEYVRFNQEFDSKVAKELERQKGETDAIRAQLERTGINSRTPEADYRHVLDQFNYDYLKGI